MFGFGDSEEEDNQQRLQMMHDAAATGMSMLGPDRRNYQLGLGEFREGARAGLRNQTAMLGEMNRRSQQGYGAGQAMYQQASEDASRRARGDALSVSGVNPAAQMAIANQNAVMARNAGALQAAQLAAREQQFADQMRAQLGDRLAQGGLGATQMQLGANQAFDAARLGAATAFLNPQAAGAEAQKSRDNATRNQIIGGLFQAGGGALAGFLSDERLKTHVDRESVASEADDFLALLDVASYEYIDPSHGEGRHYSAMAQSVAKSNLGRSFVVETPEGLALDVRRGFGAMLAVIKRLGDRVAELEGRE